MAKDFLEIGKDNRQVKVAGLQLSVVLSRHYPRLQNLLRHFAVENSFSDIVHLGKKSFLNYSLGSYLFGLKEWRAMGTSELAGIAKGEKKILVSLSLEDRHWLEYILFLNRSFPKSEILLGTNRENLVLDKKEFSRYGEKISGIIMEEMKGYDEKYTEVFLRKHFSGVPLTFISDGTIKLGRRFVEQSRWAA